MVLAAVETSGYALQYASPRLRADVEVARKAVQQSPDALAFADAKLRANKALVLQATSKKIGWDGRDCCKIWRLRFRKI